MSRPRSLRTAASQILPFSGTDAGLRVSKATPPAQSSALWHSLQYCLSRPQLVSSEASSGQDRQVLRAAHSKAVRRKAVT